MPLSETQQRHPRPYNNNRHSQIYHSDIAELGGGDAESYSFVPLALDPLLPTPLPSTSYRADTGSEAATPRSDRPVASRTLSNHSETPSEQEPDRYDALGRKPVPNLHAGQHPPHIAFQEKGRQASLPTPGEVDRKSLEKKPTITSAEASPYPSRTSSRTAQADISSNMPSKTTSVETGGSEGKQKWDNFKLGEVPRERRRSISGSVNAPNLDDVSMSFSPMRTVPQTQGEFHKPQDSGISPQKQMDTSPDESVSSPGKYSSVFSHSTTASQSSGNTTIDHLDIASSIPRREIDQLDIASSIPRKEVPARPHMPSERGSSFESRLAGIKPTQAQRPPLASQKTSNSDSLGASSLSGTPMLSLSLRTPVCDFSQDEDIARILGSDNSSTMLLRKVSNAVRHGRSFSDLAGMENHILGFILYVSIKLTIFQYLRRIKRKMSF